MKKILVLISIVILILTSGCTQKKETIPINQTSTEGNVSTIKTNIMISNFAFVPAVITIKQGDTVTWINLDKVTHTVTSTTGTFDSGRLDSGKKFTFKFDNPGTYEYSCTIHPTMAHGKIIVT